MRIASEALFRIMFLSTHVLMLLKMFVVLIRALELLDILAVQRVSWVAWRLALGVVSSQGCSECSSEESWLYAFYRRNAKSSARSGSK